MKTYLVLLAGLTLLGIMDWPYAYYLGIRLGFIFALLAVLCSPSFRNQPSDTQVKWPYVGLFVFVVIYGPPKLVWIVVDFVFLFLLFSHFFEAHESTNTGPPTSQVSGTTKQTAKPAPGRRSQWALLAPLLVIGIVVLAGLFMPFTDDSTRPTDIQQQQPLDTSDSSFYAASRDPLTNSSNSPPPEISEPKPQGSTKTTTKAKFSKAVFETQNLLASLGYHPGEPDGIFGPQTQKAIESFQRDSRIEVDGKTSTLLLEFLHSSIGPEVNSEIKHPALISMLEVVNKIGIPSSFDTDRLNRREVWYYGQYSVTFDSNTLSAIDWTGAGHLQALFMESDGLRSSTEPASTNYSDFNSLRSFTLGSHKSEVLAVHGNPLSVDLDVYLGIEAWNYAEGQIVIGATKGNVIRWSNSGGLNANLVPGRNISDRSYFQAGSHLDDVIKLEGTPSEIQRNYELGTEKWKYKSGTVEIDSTKKIVISWVDNGALHVKKP